jgi:hypothetical protein
MLIKYSNASLSWDTKPNASGHMAYTRYFMAVTPYAEADKTKKKFRNGQSEAWLLIESL